MIAPIAHGNAAYRSHHYLLTTKLARPPLPLRTVQRQQLLARLEAMPRRRLTLLAAPAGWGKTTLANEWLAGEPNVAWVALDSADNDPARFWAYVFAALDRALPQVSEHALMALQHTQPPPVAALLASVLNNLARLSEPVTLVLDDYHLITNDAIHADADLLIERAPPQLHLVLTSRAEPPLALARLRARGQLCELHAADLQFDLAETTAFFADVMHIDLAPEQVQTVLARTEGWIAGLQLAGLALQECADHTDFVRAFAGTHRYILDYLTDEVLRRQPAAVQHFLLHTALLERLHGPLCDTLTGRHDGALMLEQLERAHVFVVPLDQEGCWYRYHHLFADVLRKRLQQCAPASVPLLHERAAAWYAANDLVADAVPHALAARAWNRAIELIEQVANTLLRRGEVATLRGWLEALPADVLHAHVRLGLTYAWTLVIEGQSELVEPRLCIIEQLLAVQHAPGEPLPCASCETLGDVTAMRAALAGRAGDHARAAELAQQALDQLPSGALTSRGAALLYLARARLHLGDVPAAQRVWAAFMELRQETISPVLTRPIAALRIQLAVAQGQLRAAAAMYRHELHAAAERDHTDLMFVAETHLGLGRVLYEWNDLDGAAQQLFQGLALLPEAASSEVRTRGLLWLALVAQARGDLHVARDLEAEAEQCVAAHPSLHGQALLDTYHVQVLLRQGNISAAGRRAQRWVQGTDADVAGHTLPVAVQELMASARARSLAAKGHAQAALAILQPLRVQATTTLRHGSVITLLIHEALVLAQSGNVARATSTLAEALALAVPEGYIRAFVDQGQPMAALLQHLHTAQQQQVIHDSDGVDYVERLLTMFTPSATPQMAGASSRRIAAAVEPLLEPLRPRELEILRLVAEGQSTEAIAEQLIISIGTVRWHLKNIFGKLDVHSRTQAVARARALRLVE